MSLAALTRFDSDPLDSLRALAGRSYLRHADAAFALLPLPCRDQLAHADADVRRLGLTTALWAATKHAIVNARAYHRSLVLWGRDAAPVERAQMQRLIGDAEAATCHGYLYCDPDELLAALRALKPAVDWATSTASGMGERFDAQFPRKLLVGWVLGRCAEMADAHDRKIEEAA